MINSIPIIHKAKIIGYSIGGDGYPIQEVTQYGEAFDPEKGLALAICKKTIGYNTGKYYETFKKWLPNANKDSLEDLTPFGKWLSNPDSVDLTSMFLTQRRTKEMKKTIKPSATPVEYLMNGGTEELERV